MQSETYETKNMYVDGRVKIRMKAGQLQVTSVFRVAPRPKRFITIYRSRSDKAVDVSGKVSRSRNTGIDSATGNAPSMINTHCHLLVKSATVVKKVSTYLRM